MTTATLGFEVQTGNLQQAIADLDKLTPAAQRAEAAVRKLAEATGKISQVAQNTGNLGPKLQQQATEVENFAKRIERALNFPSFSSGNRVGTPFENAFGRAQDIQAYGNELDRLRSKFNPAFSILRQYRTGIDEIRDAYRVGAISANEMTAAIDRQRAASMRAVETARLQQSGGQGGSQRPGISGMQGQMQSNLMFQFQDVAVTAAMGMNPLMIALQQGTQIGAVFTEMSRTAGGAKAGITALGGALKSLFSVTNLLPIAFIAAGAAALQYFFNTKEKAVDLNKALNDELEAINALGKQYGLAAIDKEKFFKLTPTEQQLGAEAKQDAATKAVIEKTNEAINGIRLKIFEELSKSGGMIVEAPILKLQGAVDNLRKSMEGGKRPDFAGFARDMKAVDDADGDKELHKIVLEYTTIVEEASKANQQIAVTAERLEDLGARMRRAGLDRGAIPRQAGFAEIDRPEGGVHAAEERTRQANAQAAAAAAAYRREIEQTLTTERNIARQRAETAQIFARTNAERIAAAKAVAEAEHPKGEEPWQRQQRIDNAVLKERTQIDKEMADGDRARAEARDKSLRDGQLELELIGKTAAEQAQLRSEYAQTEELRKRYLDTGVAASKAELAAIEANSAALGAQADARARLNLQTDLAFEAAQQLRSEEDKAIAARQHGAGLEVDLNSAEAQMMRHIQQVERLKDTWQEVFDVVNDGVDTIVDALFEGTDSWEETFKKIGRQFARQMFDLAVTNPLKNWLTGANNNTIADMGIFGSGASSGRGGGFGGVLGNLLGAQKAIASMQVQAGIVNVNGTVMGAGGIPGVPGTGGGGDTLQKTIQSRIDSAFGTGGGGGAGVDNIITGALKSAGTTSQGIPLSQIGAGSLTAKVSTEYASRFQGLLNDLKSAGYPISSLGEGGYSRVRMTQGPGTGGSLSKHSFGEALDINPNVNKFRPGARGDFGDYGIDPSSLAKRHGLKWGGDWRTPDTMHFQVDKSIEPATKAITELGDVSKVAAVSLSKAGLAGFETVKGLTDAAGGLTKFGSALSSFMMPGGGSGGGWFQGLSSLFGGASGAVGYMQSISPAATASIIGAGGGFTGLYHSGGIAGFPTSGRYVPMGMFNGAMRYHNGGYAGLMPNEVPAILQRGERISPVGAGGNDNSPMLGQILVALQKMKLSVKNVNIQDKEVVGDYLHTERGEEIFVNTMRRTGTGRSL